MGARAMIPSKPIPLILDDEGRAVDTAGKTVQPLIRQPTIKVSITSPLHHSILITGAPLTLPIVLG